MTESGAGTVGIIGLGLIGGSLARALVVRGVRVRGAAASATDRARAAQIGVQIVENARGMAADGEQPLDVVVIAAPLGSLGSVVAELLDRLPDDTLVLHAAGLQRQAATALPDAAYARVIGTHPVAGSHEAGFDASRADLFAGATVYAEARATAVARARIDWLWRTAGVAAVEYWTAEAHDATMAWVSHLPQLASTALAAALDGAGVPSALGGPGLRDTTRLAASPFEIWRDVLRAAPSETAGALLALGRLLEQLGTSVASGDETLLATVWERARDWRGVPRAVGTGIEAGAAPRLAAGGAPLHER